MLSKMLKNNTSRIIVALALFTIFTLDALGHLESIKPYLKDDSVTVDIGNYHISLYMLIKGILTIVTLGWIANVTSTIASAYLHKIKTLKANNRALLIKGLQFIIYTLVIIIGLDTLEVNLKMLSIFSGTIGIGIGFGLQKIASNFISGFILLIENSVEEGDLIELHDGTYGFVRYTGARHTVIETLDTKEVMVPNEDFITNRVINWTYSTNRGRVEIPVGVAYSSDIEQVRDLLLESAKEYELSLDTPSPKCYLREYGDSSVNFVLHFWVDNIAEDPLRPQSDVMRIIWKNFAEAKIEIPFPQRDIHIKADSTNK